MNHDAESIIKPVHLERRDTIGIIAPASSFDVDNFKLGVHKLRKLGYRVKYERSIFSKYWSRSGNDKKRAEQINRMFASPDVKAILCAKAGYGSIEIIPYLDRDIIRQNPKIFVGYSDITILLLYLQNTANMVVFHGPVVSNEIYEGMNPLTQEYLFRLLTQNSPLGLVTFSQLQRIHPGKASGIFVGGNISLIVSTLDTSYEIDTTDRILFLEDVNEDMEAMKGYFMRLRAAGKFKNVRGVVFGTMVDCFEHSGKQHSTRDILQEMFSGFDFPIIFGFPSGHTRVRGEPHVTLPFGVPVSIDADSLTFTINEAGVR